jgi:hypothetical protein
LRALTDPFNCPPGVACIPDDHDLASFKQATSYRETFSVGTNGIGFVILAANNAANNTKDCAFTTNAFAGTFIDVGASGVTQVASAQQSNLTSADLSELHARARIVGCGIRVRYIGTELDRSGQLIGASYPSFTILNGRNIGEILANTSIQTTAVDRKWHAVAYVPTIPEDYSYGIRDHSVDTYNNLGLFVNGGKAGISFEFEIIHHYEMIPGEIKPSRVLPFLSASHSDVVGMGATRSLLEGKIPVDAGPGLYQRSLEWISSWTPQDVSRVVEISSAAYSAVGGVSGLSAGANLLPWR